MRARENVSLKAWLLRAAWGRGRRFPARGPRVWLRCNFLELCESWLRAGGRRLQRPWKVRPVTQTLPLYSSPPPFFLFSRSYKIQEICGLMAYKGFR